MGSGFGSVCRFRISFRFCVACFEWFGLVRFSMDWVVLVLLLCFCLFVCLFVFGMELFGPV